MKVKSIFERLDGCWSDSWDSLTDEQQDAWKEAGFTNAVPKATTRTINEAGVVRVENVVAPAMERTPWIAWDWLTPEQRESHARQHDATHALCDPIAEARAFDLVFQLDDAEKTAARLREAAEWSTGLERESNIRQLQEAEAEAARIRAELDCIEQRGENETAEVPDPDESTPADARQVPDTTGLVAWQAAALENWPEIVKASGKKKPDTRVVLRWLRENGPTDVFPRGQEKKRDSIEWLDGSGNRQTLTLKSLSNRLAEWRKAGTIPA